MTSINEDNPDLSLTSPADDSDTILSPVADPEPNPGLDGMPVRCESPRHDLISLVSSSAHEYVYRQGTMYVTCFSSQVVVYFNTACKADRTEPYTRITPFQERHDTSVEYVTCTNIDPCWIVIV